MKLALSFVFALFFLVSSVPVFAAPATVLPKGYLSWKKSERKVDTDKSSIFYGIHYIYADKTAMKGYQAGNRFADGSRIVVEYFNIKGNPAVDGPKNMVVLMRKDKRFKQTGGWQFAGFGADGKPSGLDPVTTCFDCHLKDAAQRDYVISTKKDFK
ncbi:MAG: cytochrome P460 family protein [Desulfuromonadales bacterium]|nr:cytochrome P460 family protein [Desulfuromonadales bacterium]